jgi:FtsX-like permease family
VTREPRLPCRGRWLLRLSPVPHEARAEVQADLHELFVGRRRNRGAVNAHRRLYHDVASLWFHRRPVVRTAALPADTTAGELALRMRLDPHAGLGRVPSSDALAITLFAVIGLVLLLACANVATVLISTAITRERELGVRAALGASRGRIVRQLVTESLALGAIAAAIGLVFAYWALPVFGTMIEAPAGTDLAPDLKVYLFLGTVTLITGVGAGLAPAWHGRGVDLLSPLKGEGAGQNRVAPQWHGRPHCHPLVRHRPLRLDRVARRSACARDGRARRDGRGATGSAASADVGQLEAVVLGLAVGAGAALLASRVVVAAMFFGVSPQDPMAFAGTAVILLVAATLAVLVPTRRAAAVDAALVLGRS